MTGLVETIESLVTNTVVSVLILLTVFAGLTGAEWVAERFRDRKRERRREALREAGLSERELKTLMPFIDYEVKHYSRFKPVVGLVAALSLVLLATRSSNVTGLVFSYGMTALVFGGLAVVEIIRFFRARRVRRRLKSNPSDLASAEDPYEVFEFVQTE
jgi:Na+/H+ antiporter NhaC